MPAREGAARCRWGSTHPCSHPWPEACGIFVWSRHDPIEAREPPDAQGCRGHGVEPLVKSWRGTPGAGRLWPCLMAGVLLAGCGAGSGTAGAALPPSDPERLYFAPDLDVDLSTFVRLRSGLFVEDVLEGEGPVARRTSRVWIEYVGWLPDGTVFDGNLGGDLYAVRLGGNEVIRGWNEGIMGMRRGGERRLVVPPGLAYGSSRRGDIPPGSTLVFYIRLVDVD